MRIRTLVALFSLVASQCRRADLGRTPQGGANPAPPNAPDQRPAFPEQTRAPVRASNVAFDVVTVAEGLQNPWGMTFLPDGRILVTEKPAGRLRIVGKDGKLSEAVAGLPLVDGRGQGGLLDVALDPDFATQPPDLLELRRAARRRR